MGTKLVTGSWRLAILMGYCAVATAQPPDAAPDGPPRDVVFLSAAPAVPFMGGPIDILGASGNVPGTVVENKAYSADSITESTQVLLDGNRIVSRNEAHVARDAAGRTRLEQTLRGIGGAATALEPATLITINDPVAKLSYMLDPVARTARRMRPLALQMRRPIAAPGDGDEIRGLPGPVTTAPSIVRNPGPAGATLQAAAGVVQFRLQGAPDALDMSSRTEDLGEQVLEGLTTRGERTTRTIPAGAVGNERAIEIVTEQWYAPDIEAVVLRRSTDPRFGEVVYRLVNVVQGEPAATLFAVPSGYEINDDAGVPGLPGAPPPGGRYERRILVAPAPGQ